MKRRRGLLLILTVVIALCGACGVWLRVQRQQYARNRQLIDALRRDDAKTALALVNAGADPNTRLDPDPAPSLKRLFDQLLHHRASPASTSPTAFMYACGAFDIIRPHGNMVVGYMAENLPLLRAMLAHGANVHARAYGNITTLYFATAQKRLHTVEMLLQHGADVNFQTKGVDTPLLLVWPGSAAPIVHLLLAYGANPNAQRPDGNTLLHECILWPDADAVVAELLWAGARTDIKNKNGDTPIRLAQKYGRLHVVSLLRRAAK